MVELFYHKFKSSTTSVLPTLSVFHHLPVVKIMLSKHSTSAARRFSKDPQSSPLLAEMVWNDIRTWVDAAREALGGVLGCPQWKSANRNALHPV
jgi:hypothetical protein